MRCQSSSRAKLAAFLLSSAAAYGTGFAAEAASQDSPDTQAPQLKRLEDIIDSQQRQLDDQDHRLQDQANVIKAMQQQLDALRADHQRAESTNELNAIRAGGLPPNANSPVTQRQAPVEAAGLPPATAAKPAREEQPAATPVVNSAAPAPAPAEVRAAGIPAQNSAAAPASIPQAAPNSPPVQANASDTVPIAVAVPQPKLESAPPLIVAADAPLPDKPVGEAPQMMDVPQPQLTALPEGAQVLTPVGRLVFEPSVEYDRLSSNRLVFRGVEIVPGIQLGLVEANQVANDTVVGTADFRYGLLPRLELEFRVPYFYGHDRLTVLSQQVTTSQPASTRTTVLEGQSIGDIEGAFRYQINRGIGGSPVWVGGLRVKSVSGTGPYDVHFDPTGVATELPTGSGFWAVSPSLTVLIPSDPAVLFASIGFVHNFGYNINKFVGKTHIGQVDPGDAITAGLGFGFALNPQFSFSLGFSNTFILQTRTELGGTVQHSSTLESGAFTVGWSYVFSPGFALSNNYEFGVTSDAPSLRTVFRIPFGFDL